MQSTIQNTPHLLSRANYYDHLKANKFGDCSFCEYEKWQIVLFETTNWLWIASLSPYWKYHTMFIPKHHIIDIDELTNAEFAELKYIKKKALNRYAEANLLWPNGNTVNVFSYSWRIREDGIDKTFGVNKSTHLHIHMWPEQDGLMSSITDPEAYTWDTDLLKITI